MREKKVGVVGEGGLVLLVGKKRILELNAPGGIQVKRREHEERGSSKKDRKAPGRRGEGDEVGETTCGGKDSSEEERSTSGPRVGPQE